MNMQSVLNKVRAVAKQWGAKATLALADQGLTAASNFLLAVLLARQLGSEQYGAWALAFEVFLLVTILYSSFILEPMSVFGASDYKDCMREYLGSVLRVHAWLSAGIIFVLSVAAWLIHEFAGADALAKAIAGIAIAAPCVLLFWVVRRTFYIELNPGRAVWGAAVYSITLLAGLGVCYRLHVLSPMTAFLLMAAAALITTPALLLQLKPVLKPAASAPTIGQILRRHWNYGRWALASSAATWGTTAILFLLLTSFRGLAATGEFKALMNFASPIASAFVAISMLSVPYGSRIRRSQGSQGMLKFARRLTMLYMGGTATYFAAMILLRHPAMHLLYGHKYLDLAGLLPLMGLGMVLRIGATAQAIPLRALQTPSLVFAAYGSSFVVAVVVGIPATLAFGVLGTVIAYVAASGSAMIFAHCLLHRKLHEVKQSIPEFQPA